MSLNKVAYRDALLMKSNKMHRFRGIATFDHRNNMAFSVATPKRFLILSLSALLLVWSFAYLLVNTTSVPHLLRNTNNAMKGERATRNRTLGFGEIFMAVLPTRTDQKDVATLLSYYSNIDITIIDGVEEVSPKAIPGGHGKGKLSDGEIGCWRVHMNMLKIVVEKRLETALIMEADADWDIRIKDQLTNLSDNLLDSTPKHPYGFSWLYLWIGNCHHRPSPKKNAYAISYADETVGSITDQLPFVQDEFTYYGETDNGKRLISSAWRPLCTTAYAVTLEGAIRMLYEIGHTRLKWPVDVEYRRATMSGKLPGLSITPPLMSQWKTGTPSDSDIRVSANKKKGSGPHIRESARKWLKENVYKNITHP